MTSMEEDSSFVDEQGRHLRTFSWAPSGAEVRGVVFVCHGYGEHLTPYYNDLVEQGRQRGLLVFGHDHVGHGLSEGERVQISSFSEYTAPVIKQCQMKKEQYPNVPLFIIGHSMGGLIALLALLQTEDSLFAGAVLMGPLIKLAPESASSCQKLLARLASKVWPALKVGSVEAEKVTSSKEMVEKISGDDLNGHGMKALHGYVVLNTLQYVEDKYAQMKTPYLLLHGEMDQICSVEGSKVRAITYSGCINTKLQISTKLLLTIFN